MQPQQLFSCENLIKINLFCFAYFHCSHFASSAQHKFNHIFFKLSALCCKLELTHKTTFRKSQDTQTQATTQRLNECGKSHILVRWSAQMQTFDTYMLIVKCISAKCKICHSLACNALIFYECYLTRGLT